MLIRNKIGAICGGGASCTLAVFDLGKEVSLGLSFKRIEKLRL